MKLSDMTDNELAQWQAGWKPGTENHILAEKEWARRERIAQHDLDLELIAKQVRWMKYSIIASVISALIGAVVGSLL